jgi:hypothetical protein
MNDPVLKQSILDALSVLSVLLIFASVLFDLAYTRAKKLIAADFNKGQSEAARAHGRIIAKFFFKRWFFVTLSFLIFAYILSPLAWQVIATSDIVLWNFDVVRTLFILIWIAVIIFMVASITVAIKLLHKRTKWHNWK